MADLPKRVWSGKKQVYSWKRPVWVKDWKLWVYDPNFKEVTNWQYYSPNRWGNVSSNAELQIYDDKDSLNPTDIGTFEDWLESTYQFVDYDGTVLKSWKVKDGETPVAPANPTREHYTFTGWNPTVWPINKNTTYSAVYAIDTFTVTFTVNDPSYGSVNPSSVANVAYGTAISSSNNTLTIWETTVTATAAEWYRFSSWGTLPATVTEDLTITATLELNEIIETLLSNENGSIIHNITNWEIAITYLGSTLIIQDKNLWATEYLWQSETVSNSYGDYYKRWATDVYPSTENVDDWSLVIQSIVPAWYHIPEDTEYTLMDSMIWWLLMDTPDLQTYALIPKAGYIQSDSPEMVWINSMLWTSTKTGESEAYSIVDTNTIPWSINNGLSVRCFKDSY